MSQTPASSPPHSLHPEDNFHTPPDDVFAFESYWFSFFVPERKLMVYVYPWFRPALGIAGGGVLAWDDRGDTAWNIVHCDYEFQTPAPNLQAYVQGTTLTVPQGITIDVLEPLKSYRLRYAHRDLTFDVTFTAIHEANIATNSIGGSQLFAGRIDQCGKVTGEVTIGSERIAVDCLSMRDRSWGTRRNDNLEMNIGYFHATASETDAFLAVSNHAAPTPHSNDENAPIVTGYLMQDGIIHPLTKGTATFRRKPDGAPNGCNLEATDAAGRTLRASGQAMNAFAFQPFSGMFNWSSLATWQFNAQTCVGELQNTWHPDRWRAFYRRRTST